MKTLKIYDPAMCCSTGICGPDVDPELIALATFIKTIDSSDVTVERFNLAQNPMVYTMNSVVSKLLGDKGVSVLPLVFINDELVSSGGYPSLDDLKAQLGIEG